MLTIVCFEEDCTCADSGRLLKIGVKTVHQNTIADDPFMWLFG